MILNPHQTAKINHNRIYLPNTDLQKMITVGYKGRVLTHFIHCPQCISSAVNPGVLYINCKIWR